MNGLELITPPEALPVSLDRVKRHLRVDHDDDDEDIQGYMRTAVDMIDGKSPYNLALMPQEWKMSVGNFCNPIYLPLKPIISIDTVEYIDAEGNVVEVDDADYELFTGSYPASIRLAHDAEWPSPILNRHNAVQISFTAGWPMTLDSPPAPGVPDALVQAILLMVGDMYEWRETAIVGTIFTSTEIPTAAINLIHRHRMYL